MIDMGQLIGQEFGTFFEVIDLKAGNLKQITDVHQMTSAFLEEDA